MEAYVLTRDDRDLLQQAVTLLRNLSVNPQQLPPNTASSLVQSYDQATSTYLVLTPSGGIGKALPGIAPNSLATPTYAVCQVVQQNNVIQPPQLFIVPSFTVTVWNHDLQEDIPGDQIVPVMQNAFGEWVPCAKSGGTTHKQFALLESSTPQYTHTNGVQLLPGILQVLDCITLLPTGLQPILLEDIRSPFATTLIPDFYEVEPTGCTYQGLPIYTVFCGCPQAGSGSNGGSGCVPLSAFCDLSPYLYSVDLSSISEVSLGTVYLSNFAQDFWEYESPDESVWVVLQNDGTNVTLQVYCGGTGGGVFTCHISYSLAFADDCCLGWLLEQQTSTGPCVGPDTLSVVPASACDNCVYDPPGPPCEPICDGCLLAPWVYGLDLSAFAAGNEMVPGLYFVGNAGTCLWSGTQNGVDMEVTLGTAVAGVIPITVTVSYLAEDGITACEFEYDGEIDEEGCCVPVTLEQVSSVGPVTGPDTMDLFPGSLCDNCEYPIPEPVPSGSGSSGSGSGLVLCRPPLSPFCTGAPYVWGINLAGTALPFGNVYASWSSSSSVDAVWFSTYGNLTVYVRQAGGIFTVKLVYTSGSTTCATVYVGTTACCGTIPLTRFTDTCGMPATLSMFAAVPCDNCHYPPPVPIGCPMICSHCPETAWGWLLDLAQFPGLSYGGLVHLSYTGTDCQWGYSSGDLTVTWSFDGSVWELVIGDANGCSVRYVGVTLGCCSTQSVHLISRSGPCSPPSLLKVNMGTPCDNCRYPPFVCTPLCSSCLEGSPWLYGVHLAGFGGGSVGDEITCVGCDPEMPAPATWRVTIAGGTGDYAIFNGTWDFDPTGINTCEWTNSTVGILEIATVGFDSALFLIIGTGGTGTGGSGMTYLVSPFDHDCTNPKSLSDFTLRSSSGDGTLPTTLNAVPVYNTSPESCAAYNVGTAYLTSGGAGSCGWTITLDDGTVLTLQAGTAVGGVVNWVFSDSAGLVFYAGTGPCCGPITLNRSPASVCTGPDTLVFAPASPCDNCPHPTPDPIPDSGSGSGSGSGGGGGTIPTPCCPDNLLPETLYLHFTGASDASLNIVVPITYSPTDGFWTPPSPVNWGACATSSPGDLICVNLGGDVWQWQLQWQWFACSLAVAGTLVSCSPLVIVFDPNAIDDPLHGLNSCSEGVGCTTPGSGPTAATILTTP